MNSTTGFIGFDGFVWFQGVVEDRIDPEKLGRVRVRILGLHTENKTEIPTEDLPWAYPISPVNSASMNGIGYTPMGPVEGTWVVGFFRDGQNCQEPVIMGTMTGIPQRAPKPVLGFEDPNANYPKSPEFILDPDINRLARNESIEQTIVQYKQDNLKTEIPVALDYSEPWSEPIPGYNAIYPFNHVYQSESGHYKEVDDTPNNERLHEYHKKGTFTEIQSDGTKVTKVVQDNYELIYGNGFVWVGGAVNLTVDGDCNILCGGSANIEVNQNAKVLVREDADLQVYGQMDMFVGQDFNLQVGGDFSIGVGGDFAVQANNTSLIALVTAAMSGAASAEVTSVGQTKVASTGSLTLAGSAVGLQASALLSVGGGLIDIQALTSVKTVASASISCLAPSVTRGGNPFWT